MKYKPVAALIRGLKMLELVSQSPEGSTLNELAIVAECSAPAAHHLAQTLLHERFLRRDESTLRFFPGTKVYTIAGVRQVPDVLETTAEILQALHTELDDFAFFFCSAEGGDVHVRQSLRQGKTTPLNDEDYVLPAYTSVGGMMHLAYAGTEFNTFYHTRHNFNAYGTVLWESLQALEKQIEKIRTDGHFFLPTKSKLQIRAGLPLFDQSGLFIGSLTCSADLCEADSPSSFRKHLLQTSPKVVAQHSPYSTTIVNVSTGNTLK